ncbi:hypothetical protein QJQ45_025843 [Haematococcus lacustris]|nr:hypothetical protein QJQ45_025843 [Haematococcus lacustris]
MLFSMAKKKRRTVPRPVPEDPDSDIDRDEALQPDLTEAQRSKKASGEARAARDRDNTYHARKAKLAHLIDHLPQELWDAFLADAVQPRVEAISERGVLASLLLGLLVRGLFTIRVADPLGLHDQPVYTDIPVSQAAIPDLSCRNLFLQLCRGPPGAGANTQPNAAVAAVLAAHPDLRARLAAIPRHLSDTNMVDHVGKQLETAFSNILTLLFAGRLKKSVSLAGAKVLVGTEEHRRKFGFWGVEGGGHLPAWSKRECTYVRRMVCGLDVNWLLEQGGVVPTPAMQAEVALQRGLLGLEEGERVDDDWVEDPVNRGRLLRHAVHTTREMEAAMAAWQLDMVPWQQAELTNPGLLPAPPPPHTLCPHPHQQVPGSTCTWLQHIPHEVTHDMAHDLTSCISHTMCRFYDRDVSAALNIRRCAVGPGPRPTELCYWDGRPAMPKPGRPGQEWVYLRDKALLLHCCTVRIGEAAVAPGEMEEPHCTWLAEAVVDFLRGPLYIHPLMTFIDAKCLCFTSDEENKFEYTTIHEEFKQLVDNLLTSFLEELGVTAETFYEVVAKEQDKDQLTSFVVQTILTVDDFLMFKAMMVKRNMDLTHQVLDAVEELRLAHEFDPNAPALTDNEVEEAMQLSQEDQEVLAKLQKLHDLMRSLQLQVKQGQGSGWHNTNGSVRATTSRAGQCGLGKGQQAAA